MRFILSLLLILAVTPALAQSDAERAELALQNIGELLENRAVLRQELAELEAISEAAEGLPTGEARTARLKEIAVRTEAIDQLAQSGGDVDALNAEKAALAAEADALRSATKSRAEERAARISEINDELAKLSRQIGAVATGVSDEEYGIATDAKFDLNAEAQALVEPFIAMLRDATENARQIERLRRDLSEAPPSYPGVQSRTKGTIDSQPTGTKKPARSGLFHVRAAQMST